MTDLFDVRGRTRGGLATALTLALCCTVMPACSAGPSASAGPSSPTGITTITLERNGFGAAAGSVLVLRRDGQANFTETGNARQGTADQASTGQLSVQDFDALARLAVSQGFFQLKDEYQLPDLQDGSWSTLGVTRNGVEKRVFRREDAGPPALGAIESAIDGVKARIAFRPVKP